jgi:hypothetical protein
MTAARRVRSADSGAVRPSRFGTAGPSGGNGRGPRPPTRLVRGAQKDVLPWMILALIDAVAAIDP